MTKLTKSQIATFEKQGDALAHFFLDISAILSKPIDRKNRNKLVQVNNFLNKASKVLASITSDDEDADEGDDE